MFTHTVHKILPTSILDTRCCTHVASEGASMNNFTRNLLRDVIAKLLQKETNTSDKNNTTLIKTNETATAGVQACRWHGHSRGTGMQVARPQQRYRHAGGTATAGVQACTWHGHSRGTGMHVAMLSRV